MPQYWKTQLKTAVKVGCFFSLLMLGASGHCEIEDEYKQAIYIGCLNALQGTTALSKESPAKQMSRVREYTLYCKARGARNFITSQEQMMQSKDDAPHSLNTSMWAAITAGCGAGMAELNAPATLALAEACLSQTRAQLRQMNGSNAHLYDE